MNHPIFKFAVFVSAAIILVSCSKAGSRSIDPPPVADTALVNLAHLNYLYIPVTFSNGTNAAGVYIYADAPNYNHVGDADEGYTCVDDVARAVLVYSRSSKFPTDTAIQAKVYNLVNFVLAMQSDNGYFYNFIFPSGLINKGGTTSINNANWWSWRALHALTEVAPLIQTRNAALYAKSIEAINKLVAKIKTDLVPIPQTTKVTNGITVPTWLPAGSGTDQAALLLVGLINYSAMNNDDIIKTYIRKLADGITLMQAGSAAQYPYNSFLSWENTWHAYGNLQAFGLLKASVFLNDPQYKTKALNEIDHFYTWLLTNGMQSDFSLSKSGDTYQKITEHKYDQIAYGIQPMVSAAAEAYKQTGQDKYADIAGHLAAWFLGANDAGVNMYDRATGRGYDGLGEGGSINRNSGAESTIEALLTLQIATTVPAIKSALYKYKK